MWLAGPCPPRRPGVRVACPGQAASVARIERGLLLRPRHVPGSAGRVASGALRPQPRLAWESSFPARNSRWSVSGRRSPRRSPPSRAGACGVGAPTAGALPGTCAPCSRLLASVGVFLSVFLGSSMPCVKSVDDGAAVARAEPVCRLSCTEAGRRCLAARHGPGGTSGLFPGLPASWPHCCPLAVQAAARGHTCLLVPGTSVLAAGLVPWAFKWTL